MPDQKIQIEKLIGEQITDFSLKASGAVNHAYYVETASGGKYIVKQERVDRELQPQNTLLIEAGVIQRLGGLGLSLPVPRVAFVSQEPVMYGYEYITGEQLIDVWPGLAEEKRIDICRALGRFHAELGQKVTQQMAEDWGVRIDPSAGLHPEVRSEYAGILASPDVPAGWKSLAERAKSVFDTTLDDTVFQFLHNDAHHENILVKNTEIVGIIDFGESEYGEIAKEFSRYIRDFQKHFQHIVAAYEERSGHKLSRSRLLTNSLLSGFMENVEDYRKGGEDRTRAERSIETYRKLLGH